MLAHAPAATNTGTAAFLYEWLGYPQVALAGARTAFAPVLLHVDVVGYQRVTTLAMRLSPVLGGWADAAKHIRANGGGRKVTWIYASPMRTSRSALAGAVGLMAQVVELLWCRAVCPVVRDSMSTGASAADPREDAVAALHTGSPKPTGIGLFDLRPEPVLLTWHVNIVLSSGMVGG